MPYNGVSLSGLCSGIGCGEQAKDAATQKHRCRTESQVKQTFPQPCHFGPQSVPFFRKHHPDCDCFGPFLGECKQSVQVIGCGKGRQKPATCQSDTLVWGEATVLRKDSLNLRMERQRLCG